MENKAIAPQQRGVSKKDQVSAFKNLLESINTDFLLSKIRPDSTIAIL